MAMENKMDEIRLRFLEICPRVVTQIGDMIEDPNTPLTARVQLMAMVLERALGKAETPVKVTTTQECVENAEARLMEMILAIQGEIDDSGKFITDSDGTAGDSGEGCRV